MKIRSPLNLSLCILLLLLTSLPAEIAVRDGSGSNRTLQSSLHSETKWVSIPDLANMAGFEWEWDFPSQKLTLSNAQSEVVFTQGAVFYIIDNVAKQIPVAPMRKGGSLYLPLELLVSIFNELFSGSIIFEQSTGTLMVTGKTLNIDLKPPPAENTKAVAPVHFDEQVLETVVIDPGHGGRDPGAIGPGGVKEKDVVLGISLALRKHLQKAGFKVYMTREKDEFVPLRDRTEFANEKKADLFISVHANAVAGSKKRKDTTRGYKIYFLSQAKNEHDKLAAMRENAVIEFEERPQDYSNLQNVLIDLAGNEYLRQSQDLCIVMDQTLSTSPVSKQVPKLHLGIGQANFWVLNGAYMPSVLVETGFISNPEEEKLLSDKKFQDRIAAALCESIKQFKNHLASGL